jgi:hypothetical protein
VYAVVHSDKSGPAAFMHGIHSCARSIQSMQLLGLQLQKRRHRSPEQAAQLADARA